MTPSTRYIAFYIPKSGKETKNEKFDFFKSQVIPIWSSPVLAHSAPPPGLCRNYFLKNINNTKNNIKNLKKVLKTTKNI